MTNLELWSFALLSTFTVSIIPILFLFLVPLLKSKNNKKDKSEVSVSAKWLNWFLCFAAGALLGDAFLHLISGHDHHGSHDGHNEHGGNGGLAILAGILVFFGIELFSTGSSCHSHGHSFKKSDDSDSDHSHDSHGVNGFLSLLADAIHNFTDGLTIAAAWAQSTSAGISTTIAIFVHEIPHELGDYAVLTRAGYSHSQVLKCQFMTAASAFLGTLLGLLLQSSNNSTMLKAFKSILPFSAGGFIYLALASIIPEILRTKQGNCKRSALAQFLVFSMGIALMTVLE